MPRSVLEMVGLSATLVFAIPLVIVGVDWVLSGRPLGLAFLAIAAGMIALEEFVVGPQDLPFEAAERLVGWVAKKPDEDE